MHRDESFFKDVIALNQIPQIFRLSPYIFEKIDQYGPFRGNILHCHISHNSFRGW